ncbi:hypothetical protein [Streptomyces sp. R44]|uniref:Condensation domain-containing protein n=1 Tax=Streptomyces sp. R44 TaxID=3238633 RepID=A0AB39TFB4_9ACTN
MTRPAGYGEAGIWLASRAPGGDDAYRVTRTFEVPPELGRITARELRTAVDAVGERHPQLRARYLLVDGEVHKAFAPRIEIRTAGAGESPPTGPAPETGTVDACHDPSGALLSLRVTLHHAACDAHSLHVLREDLGSALSRVAAGAEPHWESRPPSYDTVVRRPGDGPADPARRAHEEYWERWAAAAARVVSPAGAHPAARTAAWRPVDVAAPRARRDVLPVSVYLAAAYLSAARLLDRGALVVGFSRSGRTPRTKDVVGFLLQPVPLLLDHDGGTTLGDLLTRTQETLLRADAHAPGYWPVVHRRGHRPPDVHCQYVGAAGRTGAVPLLRTREDAGAPSRAPRAPVELRLTAVGRERVRGWAGTARTPGGTADDCAALFRHHVRLLTTAPGLRVHHVLAGSGS